MRQLANVTNEWVALASQSTHSIAALAFVFGVHMSMDVQERLSIETG
jgi:hypothetical protein